MTVSVWKNKWWLFSKYQFPYGLTYHDNRRGSQREDKKHVTIWKLKYMDELTKTRYQGVDDKNYDRHGTISLLCQRVCKLDKKKDNYFAVQESLSTLDVIPINNDYFQPITKPFVYYSSGNQAFCLHHEDFSSHSSRF